MASCLCILSHIRKISSHPGICGTTQSKAFVLLDILFCLYALKVPKIGFTWFPLHELIFMACFPMTWTMWLSIIKQPISPTPLLSLPNFLGYDLIC